MPPKENLAEIAKALKAAGNRDVETVELAGLNHLFQPCKTGAERVRRDRDDDRPRSLEDDRRLDRRTDIVEVTPSRSSGGGLPDGGRSSVCYLVAGSPQVSVKNPAVTILPGALGETGTSMSITAKSGSLGTWRALFR